MHHNGVFFQLHMEDCAGIVMINRGYVRYQKAQAFAVVAYASPEGGGV
jgi:hypothetical protein